MQSFLHPIMALGLYWAGSCPRVHKKRQTARHLPLFAFYQTLSAGTEIRHFHNPCARTASRLSLGPAGGDSLAIPGTEGICLGFSPLRSFG